MNDLQERMLEMLDRIHLKMEAEGAASSHEVGQDEHDLFNEIGCLIAEAKGEYEPPDPPGWEGGFADNH